MVSRGAARECSPGFSRGAATECSPGREPGVFFRHDLSPVGAKECSESFAPTGLRFKTALTPGLRPGLHSVAAPRLNPGLHSVAAPRLNPGLHSVAAPRLNPGLHSVAAPRLNPGLHSVAAPRLNPGLHSVAAPRLNTDVIIHSGRSTGSPRVLFPAPGPHRTQPVRDRARCATALLRGIGVNYRVLFPVRCVYRDDPKIRSRSRGAARTAV